MARPVMAPHELGAAAGVGAGLDSHPEPGGDSDAESSRTVADDTRSIESVAPDRTQNGRWKAGRRKAPPEVVINVAECEYEVVRQCAEALGWKLCENYYYFDQDGGSSVCSDSTDSGSLEASSSRSCTHRGPCSRQANVIWHDHGSFAAVFHHLLPFQKVNHLPGLSDYARKIGMTSKLARMRRVYPKDFSFYPSTWVLPHELHDFRREFTHVQPGGARSSEVFILKPDGGCQGRGITLTNSWADVAALGDKRLVAQRYLRDPLLIDGLKCDLRLYVLVTSVEPLRIYLHRDGLVRLCTANYREPCPGNLSNTFMHLTNYAIQKNSRAFDPSGTKRSLAWLFDWLRSSACTVPVVAERGVSVVDGLWRDISDVVVKTILPVVPSLKMHYRWEAGVAKSRCFALLGFDLMLDSQLKPWLLEINHMPSLRTDTNVDREVKSRVVSDTLSLLFVSAGDRRRHLLQMWRKRRARGVQARDKSKATKDPQAETGSTAAAGSVVAGWRLTKEQEKTQSIPSETARATEGREKRGEERPQEDSGDLDTRDEACKGGFVRVYPSPLETTSMATREGYEAFLKLAYQLEHKHILRKPSAQQVAGESPSQQQEAKTGTSKASSLPPCSRPARRSSPSQGGEGQEEEEDEDDDVIEVEESPAEAAAGDGMSSGLSTGTSSSGTCGSDSLATGESPSYRQLQARRRTQTAQSSRTARLEQQRSQKQSAVLERLEARERKMAAKSSDKTTALTARHSQHQAVRVSYYPLWEMEGGQAGTARESTRLAMQGATRHFHRTVQHYGDPRLQGSSLGLPLLGLYGLDCDEEDEDEEDEEEVEGEEDAAMESAKTEPVADGDDEARGVQQGQQQGPLPRPQQQHELRGWCLLQPSCSPPRFPVPPGNSSGRRLWTSGWAKPHPGMTGGHHLQTVLLRKEAEGLALSNTGLLLRRDSKKTPSRTLLSTVREAAGEGGESGAGVVAKRRGSRRAASSPLGGVTTSQPQRTANRGGDALTSPLPVRQSEPWPPLELRSQRVRAAMVELGKAPGSGSLASRMATTLPSPDRSMLPRRSHEMGETGKPRQSLMHRRRASAGCEPAVEEDDGSEVSAWVQQRTSTARSRRGW